MEDLNKIINDPTTHIVDVRTVEEFESAHVEGSENIPLNTVPENLQKFKEMEAKGAVVLCCLSGGRSGQATMWLQNNGVKNVYNGGGYADVMMHKL